MKWLTILLHMKIRKARAMNNYTKVYHNAIDKIFCKHLIDKFEENTNQQEKYQKGAMSFTQLDLGKYENWKEESGYLKQSLLNVVSQYANELNIGINQWPVKYGYETLRIKKYFPNGKDQFGTHVDVNNYDNARRFLVFYGYLNNNKKGATVVNPKDDMFVSDCKQGSVLVFPPMWPWLHEGKMPVDEPKYIIGSYLHYV